MQHPILDALCLVHVSGNQTMFCVRGCLQALTAAAWSLGGERVVVAQRGEQADPREKTETCIRGVHGSCHHNNAMFGFSLVSGPGIERSARGESVSKTRRAIMSAWCIYQDRQIVTETYSSVSITRSVGGEVGKRSSTGSWGYKVKANSALIYSVGVYYNFNCAVIVTYLLRIVLSAISHSTPVPQSNAVCADH